MSTIWLYSLVSVVIVSLLSLLGVITLAIKEKNLNSVLLLMVSFAVGALFGDAFIHLLPEAAKDGFSLEIALYILSGIIAFYILEKVIRWRHCHQIDCEVHPHHLAPINLIGDGMHNFLDGMLIGGAYLASIPLGIATTVAIVLHEIPKEIGSFGILLHAGLSRWRAIGFNFLSALVAILGTILAILIGQKAQQFAIYLIPFTIGGFIYIAGSDLIPETHKETSIPRSLLQLLAVVAGIGVMLVLLKLE